MGKFAQSLFGTIAGSALLPTDVDFIPNGRGGIVEIRGDAAMWLGLENPLMQKYTYDYCFAFASVVDSLAEKDLTGEFKVLRKGGKGKDDDASSPYAARIRSLLMQPNPLQSWAQFRGQQIIYKKTFGYCPVLPIRRAGFGPEDCSAIVNLPPWLFDAVPFEERNIYEDKGVKEYTFSLFGKTTRIPAADIIILEDSFMQNEKKGFLLPQSKLVGLDWAVSNLLAAMEADNVLLRKKGPLGFISQEAAAARDIAGTLPMTKKQKNELQDSLTQYGLTLAQFQYVISRTPAKWNPMSYNTAELGTKATIVSSEKSICHRMNYPYVLYEVSESTFSNSNKAHQIVYQDNVIPNAERDIQKYEKYFEASKNNCVFWMSYEHLPVMQEDKKMSADALRALNDAKKIEYENNIITLNMWRIAVGQPITTDGDVYKSQQVITPPAV